MRTNFTHLKKYPPLYAIAIKIEKRLLTAEDEEDLKQVGNSMRRLLEGLIKKMIQKYCRNYKEKKLFFKCERLYEMGAIDWLSWDNLKYLIDKGNECSHFGTAATMAELKHMYKRLYEESYKIAAFYLTDEGYRAYEEHCDACAREARARRAKAASMPVKKPVSVPVNKDERISKVSIPDKVPVKKVAAVPPAVPVAAPAAVSVSKQEAKPVVVSTPAKASVKKEKNIWGTIFAAAIWIWVIFTILSMMSF